MTARNTWSAALAALLLAPTAMAQAPSPERWEGYREEMRTAAVHVQAEVVSAVIPTLRYREECTVDAVARRTFRGREILPEGARFRVRLGCAGRPDPAANRRSAWGYGGSAAKAREGRAVWPGDLREGRFLEIYMDPAQTGPAGSFARAGDAVLPLDGVTDRPALPMPPQPSGARVRPVTDRPHTRPAAAAVPLFPARDATITYRSSQMPGTDLRARYDAAGWRMRVDYPGNSWGGVLITDAFARAITRTNPSTAEFSVAYLADGPLSERMGRLSRGDRPVLTAQGEDTVAGLRCTVYRIRSEIRDEPEATACVTSDGLQLRRTDAAGSTEVASVRYGEADPDDFQVSSRFKEVAPPR